MESIGVRELRQSASQYLSRVAAGELFEITDRGRPIARLVPITDDPWQDLINAGEVVPRTGRLDIREMTPDSHDFSASEALEQLRSAER
jgi:prevent-host-death family protein